MALPWGRSITAEDLEALPDDGHRYELVDGNVLVTPAPGKSHQRCVTRLIVLLDSAAGPEHLVLPAPFDWVAGEQTLFQPDVVVTLDADVGPRRLESPPLVAVEVLSPGTRLVDLNLKRAAYQREGVPAYWLVDPDEPSLVVLRLAAGVYQEVARVVGEEAYEADFPFRVTITPARLLD
jgi:Uma2 family endonuclease